MAAPTNTYVAWATGNDYKGPSFTDGAYTSATKTLTKAGAFAATKVGHWLYLESNDGGSIVAGYYKVADVSGAPNSVVLATDAGAGVDDDAAKCTQHDGTTTKPWRSVQGALDLITRDATNGDQINVKAGSAQVLSAALALTTYGTPAEGAPLILCGCNASWVADGTLAEIDCGGFALMASNAGYVALKFLQCHTPGTNAFVNWNSGNPGLIYRCEFHKGASTISGVNQAALQVSGAVRVVGCNIHDWDGASARGVYSGIVYGCTFVNCTNGVVMMAGNIALQNHFADSAQAILIFADYTSAIGNTIYSSTARTTAAIIGNSSAYAWSTILNNLIVGYSGAGGDAIDHPGDVALIGHNAYYNNTNNRTIGGDIVCDLGGEVVLAADPFVDAANGDFSLTAAAKAALRGVGWPASYLGAHANTDGHVTIGAIQYGEDETAAAVYPAAGDVEDGVTYGPTGADYTGTVTLPAAEDVETGVQYGAGGTEFTGTLAGGGGGGPVVGSRIVRGLGAV